MEADVKERARRQRSGQVLIIFAFGLVGILAIAALVFDIGADLVERRTQQKGADAAALAGARYLTDDGCKGVYTLAACPAAHQAAVELATKNSYTDGGVVDVTVKIPPGPESNFHNQPGHIQVTVTSTRATFFAGVLGIPTTRVSTIAVARNANDLSVAHSMIALAETDCQAAKFGGNGTVTVEGSIQVDSTCPNEALFGAGGNVTVHAPACYVVGGYKYNIKSDVDCDYPSPGLDPPTSGVEPAGDPLASLRGPSLAGAGSGAAVRVEAGSGTPDSCPIYAAPLPPDMTDAGTMENPKTCKFTNGDTTYRLYPGVYWGGIAITGKAGMVIYMEPGIYYMAGGGFSITGNDLTLTTVATGGTTAGGGILLYNNDDPYFRTVCADPSYASAGCIGAIRIAGTGSPTDVIHMEPYEFDPYKNILIYQERNATRQPGLDINGEGRVLELSGTIYAPEANIKLAGNGESIATQIISNTWDVTGNGNLTITYDADSLVKFRGTGLVQ
jgi:Flp pilus assembly protein TadG